MNVEAFYPQLIIGRSAIRLEVSFNEMEVDTFLLIEHLAVLGDYVRTHSISMGDTNLPSDLFTSDFVVAAIFGVFVIIAFVTLVANTIIIMAIAQDAIVLMVSMAVTDTLLGAVVMPL